VLHGSVGFVLAAAGWWFGMWHFVPIYGSFFVNQVLNPILGVVGGQSTAEWFLTKDGIFTASLIVVAICSGWVALGLGGYSKLQKWCLWLGGLGMLIVFALLLFGGKGDFTAAFNREAAEQFGAGSNAYQRTLDAGGYDAVGLGFPVKDTLLLIPMVLFWNVWVVWGATLAGEVRGARDFRRNVFSMGAALIASAVLALLFFALVAKTMGWDFYNAANNAYWGTVYETAETPAPLTTWPAPFMLVSWLVDSGVFQILLIALGAFWFLGLMGTLFLSATRVIFAAAFDRVLPEPVASVSKRLRVPWVALLLLMVPGVIVSALYAYWGNFATYTLDTLLLITVTFLGSAIAATVLPWRAKRVYQNSPIARYTVAGIPLLTICGGLLALFLGANLFFWLKDDVYGVNNKDSLLYLAVLYGIAIAIYVVARLVRRRQGIALNRVHSEIPSD
jgi:amino acid transporter